ncbi:MAG: N-acetylneuraminate synthase family protein [Polyangiaceae bacterium]|nr:N-acetylneuraminate synthase family protein [Polyangiaceae bacterium]
MERAEAQDAGCLVIGEVAQAHDGSLGFAHAFIDAVAAAGAGAVKFQTHIAAAESTPAEPWRVKFSPQDDSRFAYWRRMEFTADQWAGLARHAEAAGLLFLSSPFSGEAVALLDRLGMKMWKLASGELDNPFVVDPILATGKPILASTGMSSWADLDASVERFRRSRVAFTLLQCTSEYPCPPERVGLNIMQELGTRYGAPVGLSDHSGTPFPSLAAVALGASVVEVHVTFSRAAFGPDVPASITFPELQELVRGVRFLEQARRAPVDKDAAAERLAPTRRIFGKSLVAARDLEAGTSLTRSDLDARKPGIGLAASVVDTVIGRRLTRAVRAGEHLVPEDLAP